ncbi:hypothetical protein [Phaeocystidibacter marisrubri]|uniref:Uncharacterized protein n=1 Tax=Phaeocystidibacter marisrubri TaxID=1577780 RepID=A0A6L3ZBT7_9FLAO|nr:hypothetical protein [Phaeocystidibacter marisrubri]KAB2815124.1 hypothetical protein F8C82_13565 [Phaeocystidibacter marisrubri]
MKRRVSLRKIVNWKHFHLILLAQALPALVFLAIWIGGFLWMLFELDRYKQFQNYGPLPYEYASQAFQIFSAIFLLHLISIYLLGLIGKWHVSISNELYQSYLPELKPKFEPNRMRSNRRRKETFWYILTASISLFFLLYPLFTNRLPTRKLDFTLTAAGVPLAFIALRLLASTLLAYKSAVVFTACLKKTERDLPTFWMALKEDERRIESHHSAFQKWWLKYRMKITFVLLYIFPFIGVWVLQPLFDKMTRQESVDILQELTD